MLGELRKIIQALNSAENLQQALDVLVSSIAKVLNTDSTSIYLTDANRTHHVLVSAFGFKPSIAGISVPTKQGLIGLVATREEPINLENAKEHPHYFCIAGTGEEKYKAFLGVPIIHQRKVLGVLAAQHKLRRRFNEQEETFLITLSAQIAGIIAHAEAMGNLSQLTGSYDLLEDTQLSGVAGSPGVVIGTAVAIFPLANLNAVPDKTITDIDHEILIFRKALEQTRKDLKVLEQRLKHLPKAERALFEAYLRILDKASLGTEVEKLIHDGNWAQGALKSVIKEHVRHFEAMEDTYLRERAADLRDLGNRILSHLQQEKRSAIAFPPHTVLVGDEVTATRLAEVPKDRLAGVVCTTGSANAHVAILARSMGLPTVMGAKGLPLMQIDGREVIVDGYNGRVHVSPSVGLRKEFERIVREEKELSEGLEELKGLPAVTPDNHEVPLLINTGLEANAPHAKALGAKGVGLYRTEVAFMVRDGFPSEDEQHFIYRQLLSSFAPDMVTIRTLDVGGDKNLPYFPVEEDNPSLGWRGIRVTLDHPEIFLVQVRAMLRACAGLDNLRIMLPMISSVTEVDESLRLITQAYAEVLEEGTKMVMPQIGVMIEVPSAVYQVSRIAQRVDFLSVGTNDLTQYLLAVDRNNSRVSALYDTLNPAVIRALAQIAKDAHAEEKPVTICGEMASDPAAALLLLALNFDGLSMNAASILKIKWVIRSFSQSEAKALLHKALKLQDATQIRLMLNEALDNKGLGGLIRAGK